MSLGTKQFAKAIKSREQLDPADYTFKGEYYVGPSEEVADAYSHARWDDDIDVENERLGRCEHCGTDHFHGAIFQHVDGGFLVIGNVCAGQFFDFPSRKSYFEAQAYKAKKAKEARDKASAARAEFLSDNPELVEALKVDHYIVADINSKLTKYGSISDRQVELVFKIAKEVAERVPEPEPQPIPEELIDGRHTFEGEVLGYKDAEGYMGGWVQKMIFRDDRGFKLYGTAPDMEIGPKGTRVKFDARVERSKNDDCFGFYKRPTKFQVLSSVLD